MEQKTSNKNNMIALCVVAAVIVVALAAYFIISGQKGENQPTVSATMELNTVNIYGAWYKKAGDSTYELRFKDNKELSYKQTAADGTVTAQSDEGTYDITDGKLILTIVAGGQTYSDTCIANVNEKQMSIVADANGSGLFNGIYDKDGADYSVPDVSDEEPSEAPETTTTAPQTTAVTTVAPETTAQTTEATTAATTPAPETTTATAPATEAPESKPAESGTIELPENISRFFLHLYKDEEFAGVYTQDEKAAYVGYACYFTDDGMSILYEYSGGYGAGKALRVNCSASQLFPQFDSSTKLSTLIDYLNKNYGDKLKDISGDGTAFYQYQDFDYVITFSASTADGADPTLDDIQVNVHTIQNFYRQDV